MSGHDRIKEKILAGRSDANIRFDEAVTLIKHLGFQLKRTRGSHHIFSRPDIPEIIHLQPRGNMAKDYQIKQLRKLILKYDL